MAAGDVTVSVTSQAHRTGTFNDGTVSGGVTISDGAMVFDGASATQRVDLGTQFNSTTSFSFGTWFKIEGNTGFKRVLVKYDLTSTDVPYQILTGSSGTTSIGAEVRTNVTGYGAYSGNLGNGWNHIIGVIYGTQFKIYVNGVLLDNKTISGTLKNNNNHLQIGQRLTAETFNGSVTTTQIFNKALSSSEISQIYNAGKDAYSPVTNGLVAQYSGRDFTGTAAAPKRIQDTATFNRSTARTFQTVMESLRKNTNANSKFVFDEVNNQVLLAHIEEAA